MSTGKIIAAAAALGVLAAVAYAVLITVRETSFLDAVRPEQAPHGAADVWNVLREARDITRAAAEGDAP